MLCEMKGCPSPGWYLVRDYPYRMNGRCACCNFEDRVLCAEHTIEAKERNMADVIGYWPSVKPL